MRCRLAVAGLAVLVASTLGAYPSAASAQLESAAVVPCSDVIGSAASGTQDHSEVVLGSVSLPPRRGQRAVRSSSPPWTYWRKYGLMVHAGGEPVVVSVPQAWHGRLAITWGSAGPATSLRFAPCPGSGGISGSWNAYAGGFYLNTRTACVPLTFTVGRESRTVHFGIGRSCKKP